MPDDPADPDLEPDWMWNTRITAEAARTALVKGRTPEERFAIYEQLIAAACEARRQTKSAEPNNQGAANAACQLDKMFYDDVDSASSKLSGFETADDP